MSTTRRPSSRVGKTAANRAPAGAPAGEDSGAPVPVGAGSAPADRGRNAGRRPGGPRMTLVQGTSRGGRTATAVAERPVVAEAAEVADLPGDSAVGSAATFDTMVRRLNKLSLEIRHDAYADIPWDDPDWALAADDPRLVLNEADPLATTDWYQSLPLDRQAEIGLFRMAACMKIGWHFENFLQRGLLSLAMVEPDGSAAFRFLHHEIIEESQHTLMFQELVNRSGLPVRGMPLRWRWAAEASLWWLVRVDPAAFFVLVLGGEDPADHLQRSMLRCGIGHPLVERIMRIHVTEEARHLSFARHYLKRVVPSLGPARRAALAVQAPLLLGVMARMMLVPPSDLRRHCGVPRSVVRQAFRADQGRAFMSGSVAKTRKLLGEVGLVPRWAAPLWRLMGIGNTGM